MPLLSLDHLIKQSRRYPSYHGEDALSRRDLMPPALLYPYNESPASARSRRLVATMTGVCAYTALFERASPNSPRSLQSGRPARTAAC